VTRHAWGAAASEAVMAGVSCDACAQLLEGYSEGTLVDDERRTFEAHVASCDVCAGLVRDYVAIPRIVRDATDVEMPHAVEHRLHRLLSLAMRKP